MELKEQIAELTETINDLKRLIAETEQAISAGNSPIAILEERRGDFNKQLADKMQSLNLLKRQYDQGMLSGMVKKGIQNDEMMSWWMNRY